MSEPNPFGFGKFVPGFDFLQNLAKGASQTIPQMPNLGNWVAPTLNVEELDKRIQDLKSVHFWLDQNAKALSATIQALEVQRMTLATLQGMNFNMGDLANALKLKAADSVVGGVQRVAETAASAAGTVVGVAGAAAEAATASAAAPGKTRGARAPARAGSERGAAKGAAGVVDPLQWWGSLTQQFQQIAANAMKDATQKTAVDATRNMATGLARETIKAATGAAKAASAGLNAATTPARARSGSSRSAPATARKPKAARVTRRSGG